MFILDVYIRFIEFSSAGFTETARKCVYAFPKHFNKYTVVLEKCARVPHAGSRNLRKTRKQTTKWCAPACKAHMNGFCKYENLILFCWIFIKFCNKCKYTQPATQRNAAKRVSERTNERTKQPTSNSNHHLAKKKIELSNRVRRRIKEKRSVRLTG